MNSEVVSTLSVLWTACSDFQKTHPSINDPARLISVGSCQFNSMFCYEMKDRFESVRILHLYGHRFTLPNRHNAHYRYKNPSDNFYHTVCIIDDQYIVDVSALILDTKGLSLRIQTPAEVNRNWLILANSYGAIDSFENVFVFLEQTTKKWHKDNKTNLTKEKKDKFIEGAFQLAKVYYQATLQNIELGNLVFTQIPNVANPHLLTLNDWTSKFKD